MSSRAMSESAGSSFVAALHRAVAAQALDAAQDRGHIGTQRVQGRCPLARNNTAATVVAAC